MTADELATAAGRGDMEKVLRLLKGGADINGRNRAGNTSLAKAILWGETSMARLLIYEGADVSIRDNCDRSPLLLAAMYGHTEIALLLVEKGAAIEEERYNTSMMQPIDQAEYNERFETAEALKAALARQKAWAAAQKKEKEEKRKRAIRAATALTRNLPRKKSPFRPGGKQ